jgi:SPP1 gp7 family putative phage head morphogenesis protein
MRKLDFKKYQDKLKDEKLVSTPTEHYYEDDRLFLLEFKSREKWEYYTVVLKSDILEFSENLSNPEEGIDMFRINYVSNHLRIEDIKDFNENQTLMEDPEIYIEPTTTQKDLEVDAGEDIVKEAENYSDFLFKLFTKFEERILAAANTIKVEKAYTTKSFGDFLRSLFNTVNTVVFAKNVIRFLKADLITGLISAEQELNMDIGFTEAFTDKLAQLQQQQINGYVINGKKWPGIKGVTKELQSDIIIIVQNGVNAKESIDTIKDNIKDRFDGFTEWRSEMIARTETNRVINEGKLLGYKESGLEGKKIWKTAPFEPGRSSKICQRLKNNIANLDDPFIDEKTLKAYMTPPAHPNCRSTIAFRPN